MRRPHRRWRSQTKWRLFLIFCLCARIPSALPYPVAERRLTTGQDPTGIVTDACDLPMCGSEGEGRLGFGDEGNPTLLERRGCLAATRC